LSDDKIKTDRIPETNGIEDDDDENMMITDEVLAIMAGVAAAEVKSVHKMSGGFAGGIVEAFGRRNLSKGVKVDVLDGVVSVDVAVNIAYGFNIPDTCKKVQEKVKAAIENMTGLEVSEVNVHVAGVDMEEGK